MGTLRVSFAGPCTGDRIGHAALVTLHVSEFPDPTTTGSLTLVEKVLTNTDGTTPAPGLPVFATIDKGLITPDNSEPPSDGDLWSYTILAGTKCPGDRTRLELQVYLLRPGDETSVQLPPPGTPVAIPEGSPLLATVEVARRDAPPDECRH